MLAFTGFAIVSAYVWSADAALRDTYPWYKTGDEIHSEIQSLSSNCPGVQFELSTRQANDADGESVSLDVVHLSKEGGSASKKAFFVFGEHARELISPESGLQLLRDICGQGNSMDQELVSKVMGTTSFVIIPNGNPISRKKVEAGEYCKRTNEENVDLNRNFGDDHRDNSRAGTDDEMNPGPSGFSEPESQIVRDLVMAEKPDIFLSVHSGAYLLGTPFGYTADRKADDEQQMMEVLKPISEKYCNGGCPFGDLAGMIGYKSQGCDIDYVKESLDTPFVFTWEIYVGPDIRRYYEDEAHSRSEGREMGEEAKQFFWGNGLGLLQTHSESHRQLRGKAKAMMPESAEVPSDCFNQFNPETQVETEETAENWAKAFLTLCDEVANYKSHAAPAPGQDMATIMDKRSSRPGSSSAKSTDDTSSSGNFDLAAVDKEELKDESSEQAKSKAQATPAISPAVAAEEVSFNAAPATPAMTTSDSNTAPAVPAPPEAPAAPEAAAMPAEPMSSQDPATSTPDSKASKVLSALSAINSWQGFGNSWKHQPTSALDRDEAALSSDFSASI